jgi:predicted kinase
MAGAGKSTLAKKLESTHSAVRLCPDEWIEPLLLNKVDRTEMDRIRPHIDFLQWTLAQRLLSLGNNVVWEQGFWHAEERKKYLAGARSIGSRVALHYIDLPISVLKERVKLRNKELPFGSFHIDPDEIDTWMTWFHPPDETELLSYDECEIYKHT